MGKLIAILSLAAILFLGSSYISGYVDKLSADAKGSPGIAGAVTLAQMSQ